MHINTGDMTHNIRAQKLTPGSMKRRMGTFTANHLHGTLSTLKPVLTLAGLAQSVIGNRAVSLVGRGLHQLGLPLWTPSLPTAHYGSYKNYANASKDKRQVVYFPSCLNRTMGYSHVDDRHQDLTDLVVNFLQRNGWQVIFPKEMGKLCCGQIWESKGMMDIADCKTLELEEALLLYLHRTGNTQSIPNLMSDDTPTSSPSVYGLPADPLSFSSDKYYQFRFHVPHNRPGNVQSADANRPKSVPDRLSIHFYAP